MQILEYIANLYPIKDRVKSLLEDPIKIIAESDALPYEVIEDDGYGELTKCMYYKDGVIPVWEILSYDRDEVMATKDEELITIWENYMEMVTVEDVNIGQLYTLSNAYKEQKSKDKSALEQLASS